MSSKQDMTYLEVVRPVSNADHFLDVARTLGGLIFESEATDVFPVVDHELTGESGAVLIGAKSRIFNVFNTEGLRLPMVEKVTISGTNLHNAFGSASRILRNGREFNKKHRNINSPEYEVEPIKQILNDMQTSAGFPESESLRVKINQIGYRFLEETGNGSIELTLIPDLGDSATALLIAQAKMCAAVLSGISKRISYPTSPYGLGIPFAQLDSRVDAWQTGRYLKGIKEVLPLFVQLHEPRVTTQLSS